MASTLEQRAESIQNHTIKISIKPPQDCSSLDSYKLADLIEDYLCATPDFFSEFVLRNDNPDNERIYRSFSYNGARVTLDFKNKGINIEIKPNDFTLRVVPLIFWI